jgi:Putative zinc-finger
MTPLSNNQKHITDLLPAYLNGSLDPSNAAQIDTHLLQCKTCQTELTNWETIKNTVHFAIASEPLPSTHVLDQVWSKIDAPSIEVHARPKSIHHTFVHVWLVFTHQIRLIHKSIWIASTLVGLFCCSLAFIFSRQAQNHLQYVTSILVLFTAVVASSGIAFLHGTENDAGFEITLATPTSLRVVMLCRMVLVIGYNFVFAAMASFIIALVHGGGIWEIMQLWLGPMLLLSSISVSLSISIGAAFAIAISLILEALQAIPITIERGLFVLQFARPDVWQTSPPVILLALLLFMFAVFYAPRQPRLSN